MLLRGREICGGLPRQTRRLWTGILSRVDPLKPMQLLVTDRLLAREFLTGGRTRVVKSHRLGSRPLACKARKVLASSIPRDQHRLIDCES